MLPSVHLYHRPAVSGPTQTPAAELPDTLGAAEGRLGVSFHITWPDPSPSLKIEVQCIDLDWAEVSQLTRGYLGLQCQSPNSSSMSVCTTSQDPKGFPAFGEILIRHLPTCPPPPLPAAAT